MKGSTSSSKNLNFKAQLFHSRNLFFKERLFIIIIIILPRTPEIGQGLGRILSCGARKQEQEGSSVCLVGLAGNHPL